MKSKTKLLGRIDFESNSLRKDLDIISKFPVFEEEYNEFNSGTWINNSLWNDDGDYQNTQYKDNKNKAKMTELGKQTLYINEIINKYFDVENLKMVRTRNLINGQVIPHKDFIELGDNKGKYIRVLIPLETSLTSYHSDEDYGVFRMLKGDIWMLDASVVHAAYNFGDGNRVILCLDFQYDGVDNVEPSLIFKDKSIHDETIEAMVFKRAPLREQDVSDFIFDISKSIYNLEDLKSAILKVSSAHVHHDIPIKETYDILIEATKSKGGDIYNTCHEMKEYYTVNRKLGERFTTV
ncbi:aspartyl/asparaginyl beta-hydroxylase domain-containing protein [Vibrio gigantis]|uniref:aspartyl/asparaginyl beta-hydroxylase domain-containing protein n=1 Tax=unclassified Vibrio TaxID=2614977 RepID=UPI0011B7C9D4|nr:aspartyl/asparaginyl beta-hydroxylase domain-containing protein [Vibrio sp. T20]